jgi:hypothetical protein
MIATTINDDATSHTIDNATLLVPPITIAGIPLLLLLGLTTIEDPVATTITALAPLPLLHEDDLAAVPREVALAVGLLPLPTRADHAVVLLQVPDLLLRHVHRVRLRMKGMALPKTSVPSL